MSKDAEILFDAVLKLSESDRAELAARLFDSLDAEFVNADVAEAWRVEIERRTAEIDNGIAEAVPWPEALRQMKLNGDERV